MKTLPVAASAVWVPIKAAARRVVGKYMIEDGAKKKVVDIC